MANLGMMNFLLGVQDLLATKMTRKIRIDIDENNGNESIGLYPVTESEETATNAGVTYRYTINVDYHNTRELNIRDLTQQIYDIRTIFDRNKNYKKNNDKYYLGLIENVLYPADLDDEDSKLKFRIIFSGTKQEIFAN